MAERKIIKTEDYPSNSHQTREASSLDRANEREKKIKQIVKRDSVKTKKRPISRRLSEKFFNEDVDRDSVLDYVIGEVLVPAAKDTLSEMVSGGIEMLLFGTSHRNSHRTNSSVSRVSYSNYYNRNDNNYVKPKRDYHYNFDNLIFERKSEADEVLDYMIALIEEYDVVTVSDLNEIIGRMSNYTDVKWGWTALGRAEVRRVRDGYILELPRPKPVD